MSKGFIAREKYSQKLPILGGLEKALTELRQTGWPQTRPLYSGRLGSFYVIVGQALTGADSIIPISLGRMPSGWLVLRTSHVGGVVTAGSNDGTDWTPTQIVLRSAYNNGTYTLAIC